MLPKLNGPLLRSALLTICVLTLLPFALRAQNATGSLLGEVQDASGARVKSANVTVTDNGSGVARTADHRQPRRIPFPDLLPGNTTWSLNATGFAEASSDVTVQVSNVRDVLVTLRPAPVQADREREGCQPSSITTQELDTTNAVNGGVVTGKDLQNIPLAARSFANIAYMVAGHRAGRAFRSYQGAHHGGIHRRQLRPEQSAHRGWRRQLRRLHWRLSAEFLARRDSRVCGANLAAERRRRPHHGAAGGHQHQERHQRLARRLRGL